MKKLYTEKPCCFKDQCKEKNCNGSGRWNVYEHGEIQKIECYSYVPQTDSERIGSSGELEVIACQIG